MLDANLSDRAAELERICRIAGDLAKSYFYKRDILEIETKRSLTDMVSQADREVEDLIRKALSEAFPDDGLLGEEHGLSEGTSGLTWVIDPIDGTAPFLNGLPGWCVSIGLVRDAEPLLGAIYAPVLDEMFIGGKGLGAKLNGQAISVTKRFDITTGLLGTGSNDRISADRLGQWHADMARQGIGFVRYGSGALMLAYVAAGRVVGFCEPLMSIWDCAAAYAIIDAAGGKTLALGPVTTPTKPFAVIGATKADFDKLSQLCAFDDISWQLVVTDR